MFLSLTCLFLIYHRVGGLDLIPTHHPILFSFDTMSNGDTKMSPFFGYSILGVPSSPESPATILIGAPRGYVNGSASGLVYNCSLIAGSCVALELPPVSPLCIRRQCEWSDDAWTGMSLISDSYNGTKFLISSPKFRRSKKGENSSRLNGLSYYFGISDQGEVESHTILPLGDPTNQTVNFFPVYSWAQSGFSAHISTSEILLGAPGVNNWNGSVIRYDSTGNVTILDTRILQLFYDTEYLGYAVSSGKYFESPESHWIAAGAPRGSSLVGHVLIFNFPDGVNDFWLPDLIIEGDDFGSYFGSVLLSVDVNGDQLDELIVGAPLRRRGSADMKYRPETGCVFIYTARAKSFVPPEIICGSAKEGARFGLAISKLGDLNADGIQDIAIAAPFDEDGIGAVYIYAGEVTFGRKVNGQRQPIQSIRPSDLHLPLSTRGFGSSIFGGVDIDSNGTPDIGIGAFESDEAVVLRSRLIITFETQITILVNGSFVSTVLEDEDSLVLRICVRTRSDRNIIGHFYNLNLNMTAVVDRTEKRYQVIDSVLEATPFTLNEDGAILQFGLIVTSTSDSCSEWNLGGHDTDLNSSRHDADEMKSQKSYLDIEWNLTYQDQCHDSQGLRHYKITQENGIPNTVVSGELLTKFCATCPQAQKLSGLARYPIIPPRCLNDSQECGTDFTVNLFFSVNGARLDTPTWTIGNGTLSLVIESKNMGMRGGQQEVELMSEPSWLPWANHDPPCVRANSSSGRLHCNFGFLDTKQSAVEIIQLDTIYASSESVALTVSISSISDVPYTSSAKSVNRTLLLRAKPSLEFRKTNQKIQLMKDEIRVDILQTFQIVVSGPTALELVRSSVWFPKAIKLRSIPSGCAHNIKRSNELVNSTDLDARQFTLERLTCSALSKTECSQISCEFHRIEGNEIIDLDFRFSIDATPIHKLIEARQKGIQIQSLATLEVFGLVAKIVTSVVELDIPRFAVRPDTKADVSPYVMGLLIGLFTLLLVILLLIKFGYFRRRAIEELEISKVKWNYNQIYEHPPIS